MQEYLNLFMILQNVSPPQKNSGYVSDWVVMLDLVPVYPITFSQFRCFTKTDGVESSAD